jgi:hypothetical protein
MSGVCGGEPFRQIEVVCYFYACIAMGFGLIDRHCFDQAFRIFFLFFRVGMGIKDFRITGFPR